MKFSPVGILVITVGLLSGIIIWVVGYFNLPNIETHRNLSANPAIDTSVNQTASTAPSGGTTSTTNSTGSSAGATGGTTNTGDVKQGQIIFQQQCSMCHGTNGGGGAGTPALWGANAKLASSNLNQLSSLVTFVKANMPLTSPGSLSQQQATDVSAFILSHK